MPPTGQFGPPQLTQLQVCGQRYQEGAPASAAACSCGTFAIGMCTTCGIPVCGDHSWLVDQHRYCNVHANAEAAIVRARIEQERQQATLDAQQMADETISGAQRYVHAFLVAAYAVGCPGAHPIWRSPGWRKENQRGPAIWQGWPDSVATWSASAPYCFPLT